MFRLSGVNLLLTYPKCDVEHEGVDDAVRRVLVDVKWTVVAKELHADGDPHLHAFVRLAKRCNLHRPDCLDLREAGNRVFHGNYVVARKPREALEYVAKGGDVRCFGSTMEDARRELVEPRAEKRSRIAEVAGALLEGKSLVRIARDDEALLTTCVLHAQKLMQWRDLAVLEDTMEKLKECTGVKATGENEGAVSVANWLTENLVGRPKRTFRKEQLWVYGPPKTGKSTMILKLAEMFRVYCVPKEDFYDFYDDTKVDVAVLDEFRSEKPITWMNAFLDGQMMNIRQKGKQTIKRKNIPCIVLSNLAPSDCYRGVEVPVRVAFESRFVTVALSQFLELEYTIQG